MLVYAVYKIITVLFSQLTDNMYCCPALNHSSNPWHAAFHVLKGADSNSAAWLACTRQLFVKGFFTMSAGIHRNLYQSL